MLKPCAVVELIWQDESGSTSATTFFAPSSLTVDAIDAKASAVASILASMTGCVLVRQRIKYINTPVYLPVASGGAPITRTGIFFFSVTPPDPDGIITVPAVRDGIISTVPPTAGYAIDLSHSDVIAFASAVVDSGITSIFGDAFTAIVTAYLQSRV